MATAPEITLPIKTDPSQVIATIDVIVKHLTALRDELAGAERKGVRYWVLVSRELLDFPGWERAGLRRVEFGAWEDRRQTRWVLFEDPEAPPELEGLEVDLTFEQIDDGPPRIASRTPCLWQARTAGEEFHCMTAPAGGA